jgi:2'-5' RNA ligase
MPRFFVAIPPTDDVRDALIRAQPTPSQGLRIVSPEDLHLTLHFLGEVSDAHVGELHRALSEVPSAPFPVSISGVGWFSQPSGAVFLYARVEPAPELLELHRRIGVGLGAAIGFQVEERPYTPHITLARCESALPPAEIEKLAQTFAPLQIESMPVEGFSLYSSEWVNGVPRYCEQGTYRLE